MVFNMNAGIRCRNTRHTRSKLWNYSIRNVFIHDVGALTTRSICKPMNDTRISASSNPKCEHAVITTVSHDKMNTIICVTNFSICQQKDLALS